MAGWSGLYDGVHGVPYSTIGVPSVNRRLRRALRGMPALKKREILRTFVTDDVGTTAAASHTRIIATAQFDQMALGGVRAVETVTDINRTITAADETELLVDIDGSHTPTFPREASGNSGRSGNIGF